MATTSVYIRGLTPDDIRVVRNSLNDEELLGLNIAGASIDLSDSPSINADQPAFVAALERLAELALEVASEIRQGDTR